MTTRRRAFNMPADAKWLTERPPFFDDIPQWHAALFLEKERQYISTPKKHLSDTAISLKQVNRYMSLYNVLLLLFPYPALAGMRNQFKHVVEDAIRLNGFQLRDFRGQTVSANELSCHLYFDECDDMYLDLESLEDAAQRGWLYDYGSYVCVWRRYVEEKEARFQLQFDEFKKEFNTNSGKNDVKHQLKAKVRLDHVQWFERYQQLRLEADQGDEHVSDNRLFECMAEEFKRDTGTIRRAVTKLLNA